MTSKSATMTAGLVEALLRLLQSTLTCYDHELLQECSKILCSRFLVTSDILFHANLLSLVSHLIQAASKSRTESKMEAAEYKLLGETCQTILSHCFILLNILHHLIEATAPPPVQNPAKATVDQNTITNPNASPIKALKKPSEIVQDLKDLSRPKSPNVALNSSNVEEKLGHFSESHHYMKLYENVRNIYAIQRNALNDQNDKVKQLIMACLECLSSLLEFAPALTIGKHTEELLIYMKSTFIMDPVATLKTVQTLLRCIFGTNVANQVIIANDNSSVMTSVVQANTGLFYPCFDQPYNELVHTFHLARDSTSTPDRSESLLFKSR